MFRIAYPLGLALVLSAGPAGAQPHASVAAATASTVPTQVADPATGAAPTDIALTPLDSRMTVPVTIGAAGPYPFIIDTGAERTVVSRELAGQLALASGKPVRLTAMSGTSIVDTVTLPAFGMNPIDRRVVIEAPALAERHIGGPGLIGLDALADHRLTINLEQNSMRVDPSVRRRRGSAAAPGEIVVTAKNKSGQLILSEAFFDGRRIRVVLDTGSTVTVGNAAFRRHVARAIRRPFQPLTLTSVTGGITEAEYARVDELKVGGVVFKGLPVAFADVAPFKRLGLERQPALMLGMDAITVFRRVDIDFPNREVRFLLPRTTDFACRTAACQPTPWRLKTNS